MIKKTEKLSKAALDWLDSWLYYALYDCCDSMRDSEKLEARFDALADDKMSVEDYVVKYHLKEYVWAIQGKANENGDKIDDWKKYIEGAPVEFSDKVKNYFDKCES